MTHFYKNEEHRKVCIPCRERYYADARKRAAQNRAKRVGDSAYSRKRRKYAREWKRKWIKKNPEKYLAARLKKFNLTVEQYQQLWKDQRGECGICADPLQMGTKYVHVDHDHLTETVRGLLCWNCNVGLGSFHDNVGLLYAAIAYLERS